MNRWAGAAHSLLRIAAAVVFICAGGLKLFGWFGGMPPGYSLTPLVLTAGVIEVVGGTLILFGLFTRPVAFLASGEMAFAYFIGHFPHGFWPVQNQGEPAVLLCFVYLFFAFAGGGPFSLDHWIARQRRKEPPSEMARAGQAAPTPRPDLPR